MKNMNFNVAFNSFYIEVENIISSIVYNIFSHNIVLSNKIKLCINKYLCTKKVTFEFFSEKFINSINFLVIIIIHDSKVMRFVKKPEHKRKKIKRSIVLDKIYGHITNFSILSNYQLRGLLL